LTNNSPDNILVYNIIIRQFGDFDMEGSSKKPIMIGVIVVCLAVAGLITFARRGGGGGIDSIPASELTWVKCSNPACKAEYQMSKKEFFKEQMKHFNQMAMTAPPITCKECGKESLYQAEKCPNCGAVFIKGSIPGDFADRCPVCKHSATEDRWKKRQSGQE
jgi:hypothetical protein